MFCNGHSKGPCSGGFDSYGATPVKSSKSDDMKSAQRDWNFTTLDVDTISVPRWEVADSIASESVYGTVEK